ncbi:LAQU0S07e03004g1_1 [Lachancea quebecensis]|uniref:LAQU0S07e03004g1_1 n=1 Tax=Lachancea quebecensis TaxID=1654605 RepID=A0A0N7MLQ1_9SACH|nr:LAQU0S07e03004g1_1 [Lachancea quebecensis]
MSTEDELLKMFFDEEFVPHAYLDLLLSAENMPISELQSISTTLLSKLDIYTDRLTRELGSNIDKLRKPTELLSFSTSYLQAEGTTKLEYYLETLGNSVKNLKDDIAGVNKQLAEAKQNNQESLKTVEEIQDLRLVKTHLQMVLDCFEQLRSIVIISAESSEKCQPQELVSLSSFKSSLKVLGDIITSSFKDSSEVEVSSIQNEELLKKVDFFAELKPIFKDLPKFYSTYGDFVDRIRHEADVYLQGKDIDPSFV